jgi:hypothetical protein
MVISKEVPKMGKLMPLFMRGGGVQEKEKGNLARGFSPWFQEKSGVGKMSTMRYPG